MIKSELRKKYLEIRDNIPNRDIKNKRIFDEVVADEIVRSSPLILTYVSFNNEVDTIKLIEHFLKSKKVAVPKLENNQMNFYFINSLGDLEAGTYNILEPTTKTRVEEFLNSTCIVPGICFSHDGHRIGYGGGYYDRFLNDYPGYTIGLTYSECLDDTIIHEDHDVSVKRIIYK